MNREQIEELCASLQDTCYANYYSQVDELRKLALSALDAQGGEAVAWVVHGGDLTRCITEDRPVMENWRKAFGDVPSIIIESRFAHPLPTAIQAPAKDGWINSEERLPKVREPVWISFFAFNDPSKERLQTVAMLDERGDWYDPTANAMMHPPTHWQPLPLPPKE